MKLKGMIRVTGLYKGKSQFTFWTQLKVGDLLEVSVKVKEIARGRSLYATNLVVEYANTNKFYGSITQVSKYLSKLEYEEIDLTMKENDV